jgi:hypothetical protein
VGADITILLLLIPIDTAPIPANEIDPASFAVDETLLVVLLTAYRLNAD